MGRLIFNKKLQQVEEVLETRVLDPEQIRAEITLLEEQLAKVEASLEKNGVGVEKPAPAADPVPETTPQAEVNPANAPY